MIKNDYELGKMHNLSIINILNNDFILTSNEGSMAGLDRFEAQGKLWDAMDKEGHVIKIENHFNQVSKSYRGGEIVERLVCTQWFVKMTSLAKKAIGKVRDGDIFIELRRLEKVYCSKILRRMANWSCSLLRGRSGREPVTVMTFHWVDW
ncbi:Valine--tRNA ligase [Gracilariopsis chorda]|uniref:valine--tRNA ligase n=1 Tax=Gracilariopsis chorda TaxID=448386 RepID=A0A2V3IKT0_9FLOR|nr:Valine--tRNA ligase [Gracilariopsis chorda]|eukprot:PXF42695.1 Valine--tRNA ligase [Gracilariopsis chorda]